MVSLDTREYRASVDAWFCEYHVICNIRYLAHIFYILHRFLRAASYTVKQVFYRHTTILFPVNPHILFSIQS